MAYRRLVYFNSTRGLEDKEAIHVRDVEKMTACTDKEFLDKYVVAPDADMGSSPDEHENDATGSYHDAGDVSVSQLCLGTDTPVFSNFFNFDFFKK